MNIPLSEELKDFGTYRMITYTMEISKGAAGTTFYYQWKKGGSPEELGKQWRGGVSLHSHTWHSHEGLAFLPGAIQKLYFLPVLLRWAESRYERKWKRRFDYSQGYWTSPVAPGMARALEARQIEKLGLAPLVSLTDHDSLDASADLPDHPASLEWTAPYKGAIFHIGIHNLPYEEKGAILERLKAYTADPVHDSLGTVLGEIAALPDVLIVFNHPLSDQGRIGFEIHESRVKEFLARHRASIHALEVNALQPWNMNRRVANMADDARLPVVSGGDRHSFEPNGAINLTHAKSFAEFVREIREEKRSAVLFMPQTHRSLNLRYAENVRAVMDDYPELPGRQFWYDRVFYKCPDGVTRSFTELIGHHSYVLDVMDMALGALGVATVAARPLTPVFAESNRKISVSPEQ